MECMHCKGAMRRGTAPFSIDRNGYHIYWSALPAWVCSQCGEAYFEKEEADKVQRVLHTMDAELPTRAA